MGPSLLFEYKAGRIIGNNYHGYRLFKAVPAAAWNKLILNPENGYYYEYVVNPVSGLLHGESASSLVLFRRLVNDLLGSTWK